MNLSKREEDLLRRGLDKATTADEAETAAKNFFKELRKRGVDGYKFVEPTLPTPPRSQPQQSQQSQQPQWTPPSPTYSQPPPPKKKSRFGFLTRSTAPPEDKKP